LKEWRKPRNTSAILRAENRTRGLPFRAQSKGKVVAVLSYEDVWRVEVKFQLSLYSELGASEWSDSRSGRFTPGKWVSDRKLGEPQSRSARVG
jgi:hypothetical protein